MVNFADAVTKVSYGKLVTKTPNKEGLKNLLHSVTSPSPQWYPEFPAINAELAMCYMGAKGNKNELLAKIANRVDRLEPHGMMQQREIYKPLPPVIPGSAKEINSTEKLNSVQDIIMKYMPEGSNRKFILQDLNGMVLPRKDLQW